MINLKKIALAMVVTLSTTVAQAEGFYMGAGAGYTKADGFCADKGGAFYWQQSCSDNNNSWNVLAGYQIGEYFAVETGYSDLGRYNKDVWLGTIDYRAKAYDLALLGIMPISEKVDLYARGGYSLVNVDTKAQGGWSGHNKGGDGPEGAWVAGAGVNVNVTDNIDVRADFKRYMDVRNTADNEWATGAWYINSKVDIDVYSLEAIYRFGSKPAPAPVAEEQVSLNIRVLFDTDKSNIKPEYQGEIQKAVDFLKAHPEAKAVIEGHTDSTASEAYNQALSERRANSVMNAIVAGGIEASRLSAVGYGETKPVASNATADGRAQNRRVVAEFSGVSIKAE